MTVVMVATVFRCANCGEAVYSTWHDGWPAPKWWHHGFVAAECRLEHAKGMRAVPVVVLETWRR